MSTPRTTAAPSWGWLAMQSLWLLPVLFGGGGWAWIGFLFIAIVARRPNWYVLAGLYAAGGIALAAIDWDGWDGIARAVLWSVAIVNGLVLHPQYLALLWERGASARSAQGKARPGDSRAGASAPARATAPTTSRRSRRSRTETPPAAEPLVAAAQAERQRLVATPDEPEESDAAPADEAAATVDLNTASRRALSRLPSMDNARARTAIDERERRGGFTSVEEFAGVVGLQPHEFAQLRAVAFCSPPARRASTRGRKLDL